MKRRHLSLLTLLISLAALPLFAGGEWYDEYDIGMNACNAGDFSACASHMKKAIAIKPASENNARTYGMNFVPGYTPYYYLGMAAFQIGDYDKAKKYFDTEANYGAIFKTPNNTSFAMMRKQLLNQTAAATPPAEDPAKKEAERLAAEKAASEKKALEDRLAASEAEKKRMAEEAAAAKNNVASNTKPVAPPTARPTPPVNPAPAPPVVVAAPKDNSVEAMQEVGRRAVSMILKGDLGSACASLEQDTVKPHFDKQPGYYLLLSYAYYLRSFNQPDRKDEFDKQAKEYVKKASRLNASLAPDDKLFSPKFVAFYKNNI
jgi:hypothetical protein